jgi:hypothetical protein
MTLQITEKDWKLFQLISTSGVCTFEQARQIYDTRWYHYKRIDTLVKGGYLIKHGSFIELAKKGAEEIGETKYRFRREGMRELHAEIANIALTLNYPLISAREVRNKYGLNRKTHLKGAILYNDINYFLYLLTEKTTLQYITSIKTEIKSFAASGICRNAIVFAPTPEVMALFETDPCSVQELLLLPYPAGIDLINNYFSFSPQQVFPDAVITNKPYAHYETKDYYVTSLILNDLAKRTTLEAYFQLQLHKPVKIICLPKQQKFFASLYPQAEIIPIAN